MYIQSEYNTSIYIEYTLKKHTFPDLTFVDIFLP